MGKQQKSSQQAGIGQVEEEIRQSDIQEGLLQGIQASYRHLGKPYADRHETGTIKRVEIRQSRRVVANAMPMTFKSLGESDYEDTRVLI